MLCKPSGTHAHVALDFEGAFCSPSYRVDEDVSGKIAGIWKRGCRFYGNIRGRLRSESSQVSHSSFVNRSSDDRI
jgi:hypothetical protein